MPYPYVESGITDSTEILEECLTFSRQSPVGSFSREEQDGYLQEEASCDASELCQASHIERGGCNANLIPGSLQIISPNPLRWLLRDT